MLAVTRVTHRRGARTAPLALAVVVAVAIGGACSEAEGGDTTGRDGTGPVDGDDGQVGARSPGDGEPGDDGSWPPGPFAVGRRTMTLVDTSRATDAVPDVQPARPDRTIEVEVVYPATGEPGPEAPDQLVGGGASVVDAAPSTGAFPLVVFAHGFAGRGDIFRGFAESWAREGYVVALPTFPLSRDGIAVADDLAHQPADVSFVIDELAALDGDDPLAELVDVDRVAVGGHSLGAATVFGVAYNSCCIDERIAATIPVAGGTLPFEGGDYDARPATPMLLVHGAQDETVPVAAGDLMFDEAEAPVWYLRAGEADHAGVFLDEPGRLLDEAVVAFLDAELKGDAAALTALGVEVDAGGIAEWRTKP